MAQATDFTVDDGTGVSLLAQLNSMMAALASSNSGTGAPPSPVGGMLWLDTDAVPPTLSRRNAANSAWLTLHPETLAANTLWGNGTGSAAAPGSVTVSQLLTMQGLLQNAATPYQVFPGPSGTGLVLQAGQGTTGAAGVTVTFPLAFTVAPYLAINPVVAGSRWVTTQGITATNFFAQGRNLAGGQEDTFFQYLAFGRYY